MNLEIILSVVVIVVTFILGLVAKKVTWISNNLIPLQNLVIGVIMALIYFFIFLGQCVLIDSYISKHFSSPCSYVQVYILTYQYIEK